MNHYIINVPGRDVFTIGENSFVSLEKLLEHYRENPLDTSSLVRPVRLSLHLFLFLDGSATCDLFGLSYTYLLFSSFSSRQSSLLCSSLEVDLYCIWLIELPINHSISIETNLNVQYKFFPSSNRSNSAYLITAKSQHKFDYVLSRTSIRYMNAVLDTVQCT